MADAGPSAGGLVAIVVAIFAAAVIFVVLASWVRHRRQRGHTRDATG